MTAFSSPKQAIEAMVAAGARFSIRRREDGLGISFFYSVGPTGNLRECRQILAEVKSRPDQFFQGFKLQVERLVSEERGR